MNSPEETQLGHDLRQLASGQPFLPDLETIGQRARQRHRRGLAMRGVTVAGAAVLAVGGLFVAVHTPGHAPAAATVSRLPSKLVSLAARIQATTGPLPGNATLIIRTQTDGNIPPQVSYNLYADSGAFYGGGDKTSLMQAIAQHQNMADGINAREVAAARYAVTGNLTIAREKMVNASPNDLGLGLSLAARKKLWAKGMAAMAEIFQEKHIKPQPMPTGKALQGLADNYVWNNSVDALSSGAGDPRVRAGVLRLLSTIAGVTVANSTAGGQPALTLTAGPEVFGGQGEQVLTVNAKTGMPISSVMPAHGNVTRSADTYQVSRVTMANIQAGRF